MDSLEKITNPLKIGDSLDILPSSDPIYIQRESTNITQYPNVAGTDRLSITTPEQGSRLDSVIRRRSWMGWFLWGDGINPPQTNQEQWDYFSFQSKSSDPQSQWQPIRMDQQPLYLDPLRISYNWPPGKFGFRQQPLSQFGSAVFYWKDKKIVRGINVSLVFPYLCNFGDFNDQLSQAWQRPFLTLESKPIETLVIVPSNKTPVELLDNNSSNGDRTFQGNQDPFPYPVWDDNRSPEQQTPWNIKVDRMGDWDADLVWEGTNPDDPDYLTNQYKYTPFNQPGQGKYLKMTVAQGSPFVWCETNGNDHCIFYNLIRTNELGQIGDSGETNPSNPRVLGTYTVPNAPGIEFVLIYGNQTNPNQFYQEVSPKYFDGVTKKEGAWNPAGKQSNHTYFAVFYAKEQVQPVTLDTSNNGNNGTDAQNNPYFYLEFKQKGKNWFVVAPVPVMRYYPNQDENGNSLEDEETARDSAAQSYAQELGQYAFNFLESTKISYQVQNMYLVTTTYQATLTNPYQAAGIDGGAKLVAQTNKTVFALLPHHYQPMELGLNPITGEKVTWHPLVAGQYSPFPASSVSTAIPKANQGKWGYWSMRGNHQTIVANGFQTQYLFQNFLPVLPSPDWDTQYQLSGIQGVEITDIGQNYTPINTVPQVEIDAPTADKGSQQATAQAILTPHTGQVQQIDVVELGHGYADIKDGQPIAINVKVDDPQGKPSSGQVQPRTATAKVQLSGDQIIAIRMTDLGLGYADMIQVNPQAVDQERSQISQPVITPRFNAKGTGLVPSVDIWQAGAGYTEPPDLIVWGKGTNAQAKAFLGGEIVAIADSGISGFTNAGAYPYIGDSETKAGIQVHLIPPDNVAGTSATAQVTGLQFDRSLFRFYIDDPGEGYDVTNPPTAKLEADDGNDYPIDFAINGQGQLYNIGLKNPSSVPPPISSPTEIILDGGKSPTKPAKITAYPQAHIAAISINDPGSEYTTDFQVTFSGGHVGLTQPPELDFTIQSNGTIKLNGTGLKTGKEGEGFIEGTSIEIHGGKGWDAGAMPYVAEDRTILAVEIVQPGSNYPPNTQIQVDSGHGAVFKLHFNEQKGIERVDVVNGGSGYPISGARVNFVSPDSPLAKGAVAVISAAPADPNNKKGIINLTLTHAGENYLPGSESVSTVSSPQAVPVFFGGGPVFANNAEGFIAKVGHSTSPIGPVLYNALNWQYLTLTDQSMAPFGAGFAIASPDAYGIAASLSAATKGLGLLYCLFDANHDSDRAPWNMAIRGIDKAIGMVQGKTYADLNYGNNPPFVTLKGALKTWTQGLQTTLSLFFQPNPYENSPLADSDWKLKYFAQYDDQARRTVINPTGGLPGIGFNSTSNNPPVPSGFDPDKNKTKKRPWHEGEMWSGFFVSDQMNDQHYFFGYYLTTAGVVASLDRAWEDKPGKPQGTEPRLWCDPSQMGTAIDQLVMTLAYDPDKHDDFYSHPELTYQKMAFFDQWNGHGWASGAQPGKSGTVNEQDAWSSFDMAGTGSGNFDGMNENSNWEGNQAWSGIVLWGAGSDRKSIADLGIYLLATGSYAGDIYFYDKNYNLKLGDENQWTWVPVTTSTQDKDKQGNHYNPGSSLVSAAQEFAGEGSCGNSTLYFGTNSLSNFFYAYPTGSKFIQSYPIAPWTLGISRNSEYMKKWANSLLTEAWRETLDTALFSPGNFLALAMGAALGGEPYYPGDVNKTLPLIERLLSDWTVPDRLLGEGQEGNMMPSDKPTSVIHLLHVLDRYGTPDWTVYGKNVDANGTEVNTMVFTATFVKTVDKTVTSTLVAFNPGWQTAYVQFYRINGDGTLNSDHPLSGPDPILVKPKAMVIKTIRS